MEKQRKLIIFGLGETAELAYYYFTYDSFYAVAAFSAEKLYIQKKTLLGLPVVDFENITQNYPIDEYEMFIAMASSNLNRDRTRFYIKAKNLGYKMASYVSSTAYIGFHTTIGENCFILEHNTVQPFVRIGNNVTLWSGNHIGHRSIINDNCFLSSHIVVSGFCEIGKNCFIGVNTSIADRVKIGNDCLIGLGSIIAKDIQDNTIYKAQYSKRQHLSAKQFCNIND
jgi:sugar O-acyltransferase (sialic acid O-acetyltransferase NeuD family)